MKNLSSKIKDKRNQMILLSLSKGMQSIEVLKISQELDRLILDYQKQALMKRECERM